MTIRYMVFAPTYISCIMSVMTHNHNDHINIKPYLIVQKYNWPGLSKPCQYSGAFPFLRWGVFFPKIPTILIFSPLSSNAIIKQCSIHIYSISNPGYHTIIYKYYIALLINILVFWDLGPNNPYDPLISDNSMMMFR